MTRSRKAIEVEASFVKWLLRFGPVGFIVGYSLTITGFAFVLWNLWPAISPQGSHPTADSVLGGRIIVPQNGLPTIFANFGSLVVLVR